MRSLRHRCTLALSCGWVCLIYSLYPLLQSDRGQSITINLVLQTFPDPSLNAKKTTVLPKLILFLHPHCRCSGETHTKIAQIATQYDKQLEVHVYYRAATKEDLKQYSNIVYHPIANPEVLKQLEIQRSGHVVICDAYNRILFQAGLNRHPLSHDASPHWDEFNWTDVGTSSFSKPFAVFGCSLLGEQ